MRYVAAFLVLLALIATAPARSAHGAAFEPILIQSDADTAAASDEAATDAGDDPLPGRRPSPLQTSAEDAPAVRVDAEARQVMVRGHWLGTVGMVELGACTRRGKTFMALLTVEAQASDIVAALDTLGLEPGAPPQLVEDTDTSSNAGDEPDATTDAETLTPPVGPVVALSVAWTAEEDGETVEYAVPLETLFWNRSRDAVLPEAGWHFTGSVQVAEFDSAPALADLTGTVATLNSRDKGAVFYYAGPSEVTGQVWSPNPELRAAKGTPCSLVIKLPPQEPPPEEHAAAGTVEDATRDSAAPLAEEIPLVEEASAASPDIPPTVSDAATGSDDEARDHRPSEVTETPHPPEPELQRRVP